MSCLQLPFLIIWLLPFIWTYFLMCTKYFSIKFWVHLFFTTIIAKETYCCDNNCCGSIRYIFLKPNMNTLTSMMPPLVNNNLCWFNTKIYLQFVPSIPSLLMICFFWLFNDLNLLTQLIHHYVFIVPCPSCRLKTDQSGTYLDG